MTPSRQAELSLMLAREAERLEALLKQMFVSKRAARPITAAAPRSIETGRAAR